MKKNNWISVKERQPEWLETVLVYFENGKIDVREWVWTNAPTFTIYGSVTHWMPLPEPPEVM